MRLLRVGEPGAERPAVESDGRWLDAGSVTDDFDGRFFAGDGIARLRSALDGGQLPEVPRDGVRIGAPLATPGKVVCIGLNYRDHAAETGAGAPAEPVVFMKDPIDRRRPVRRRAHPARLARRPTGRSSSASSSARAARYLADTDAARDVIAGYVVSHDVSEREFQLERGGQWDKGKSCETFNPLGP